MAKLSVPQSLSRAKSLEKKGELQKAQQIYRQILQAFPNNLRASQALSALTVKSSNRGLSQADLDHLGKLYSQEDYDRLIKDTNTMLSKFPKSFMLWNILGAAHKARLDFGEAENAFRQACQINPDNLDSQMNLRDVLLTLNRHNEAEPCFERALKIKPRFNEAYQKLGIVKARQQFYQDAVLNFQKALAQNPSSSDVKTKLARAYFELNEPAKATELLSALWTEGYRSLDYLHVLSQRQLSFPNLDINSELDDLIKLDSDLLSNSEGMIAFIRGRAYALAGKHEKAFEHLKIGNSLYKKELTEQLEQELEGGQKTTNTLKNAQVGSNHEDSNYPRLLEILGPSRSGKTTLETLVSTLEGVSRGYESGIISDTSDKVLASVGLPKTESLSALPEIQKELFRNQVRSHLENTFGSKDLITITRPGGIYSAPTLPALIPKIKFVFIQRDMDDLTYRIYASNYRQSNAYSYSIRTIRQYIEWYTQIMLSMKEKFPDIVHLISYEQMVENPQATLSDIAEFVGLAMSKHDIFPIHDDRGCAQPYIQFMADEAEREGH